MSEALEQSDRRMTEKLDSFGSRLELLEMKLESGVMASGNVGTPGETVTIAEAVHRRSIASTGFETPPEQPIVPEAKEPLMVRTTQADNQRERYMQKFEKDEIFGKSVEALESEKQKQSAKEAARGTLKRWMLMPGSSLRLAWDFVSVVLVLFVAISLPYRVAFLMDYISASLNITDFLIDIFFLFDIAVNFRTAFIQDGELISDPMAVAKNYLRLWFWLDAVSSIPFDWFFEGGLDFTVTAYIGVGANVAGGDEVSADTAALLGIGKAFKILKLVRLLRVVRLFRYIARWEDTLVTLTSTTLRMLKLILIVLVFSHWNGKIE